MSTLPPRTPWFLALARRYARRRLARGLDGVRAAGVEGARAAAARAPLILVANHVGWWDSFLVVALDEALGTKGYALMDAANLRGLPFFARLGALPLERGAAMARSGLRAAAARLDRPGRAVWIFPQGRHRPAHLRPLGFEPGVRLLARYVPDALVIPIGWTYAWNEAPVPAAWAALGAPLPAAEIAAPDGTERVEAAVAAELARIDAALDGADGDFRILVRSRRRGPHSGLAARLLGAHAG